MKELKLKISLMSGLMLLAFHLFAANPATLNCDAYFTYEDYQGPNPVIGGVTFTNASAGDFDSGAWDFGDGSIDNVVGGNDPIDHFYASDGVYTVCLTIWDDAGLCTSQFCSDVIVGNLADICNLTDCVFPGDANDDGEANFYDLLNIGLGNGLTGPPRDNATLEWVGQLATDWSEETPDGVNYKHFDCDGNGIIDENDALAITNNYVAMDAPNPTAEASAPLVYLEFDMDTIWVGPNSSLSDYEITAHLKVGTSDFPADEIYGLAMYLGYPNDLVAEDSIFVQYDSNSFFGAEEEVFWIPNNQHDEEQIDLGITRNDGLTSTGFGKVGDVTSIISSDIIDGRIDDGIVVFFMTINGVKMIDADGNELPINLTSSPATLIFAKEETTSTNNPELENKVQIYPNPTDENVVLDLSDLKGESVQVFNNFGQLLLEKNIQDSTFEINAKQWQAGVYFVSFFVGVFPSTMMTISPLTFFTVSK